MVMRGHASVVGNHLGGLTAGWAQVHNNQIVVGTKAGPLCKIVVKTMPTVYLNIILIYFSIGKLLLLCTETTVYLYVAHMGIPRASFASLKPCRGFAHMSGFVLAIL